MTGSTYESTVFPGGLTSTALAILVHNGARPDYVSRVFFCVLSCGCEMRFVQALRFDLQGKRNEMAVDR